MKKLPILCCALVLFLPTAALGSEGATYISGSIGLPSVDLDITSIDGTRVGVEVEGGFLFAAALGRRLGDVRLEGEVGWQRNDFRKSAVLPESNVGYVATNGDLSMVSLLLSGYYDIDIGASITPFIGAGLGLANVKVNEFDAPGVLLLPNDDDTVFAYHVGGGIAWPVSDTMTIDLKYRHFWQDPRFGSAELEVRSHDFALGLRVAF